MAESEIITPSAQTCPECGGAMRQETLGTLIHFRCHIGHKMTAEFLASGQIQTVEYEISALLRLLNERAALCREIASKHRKNGGESSAQLWEKAADEAAEREAIAKQLTELSWTKPEEGRQAS